MKIQYMSDLHLEGANLVVENSQDADLLILAGDITTHKSISKNLKFFEDVSNKFDDVVYINGNHEFYRGDIEETPKLIREVLVPYKNIHYLNNQVVVIKGQPIFGGTLWTDCNGDDPVTKIALQTGMNDYRLIQWKSRQHWKLRPDDTVELHRGAVEAIIRSLELWESLILVTHHGPSYKSVHPMYEGNHYMNGGYVSDLEWFMERYNIPLWFHGHVHNTFDYHVGKTNVLTNPRGYMIKGRDGKAYTENEFFDPRKIIEI